MLIILENSIRQDYIKNIIYNIISIYFTIVGKAVTIHV